MKRWYCVHQRPSSKGMCDGSDSEHSIRDGARGICAAGSSHDAGHGMVSPGMLQGCAEHELRNPSAQRNCSRRSRTLPDNGPSIRAMSRPLSVRKVRQIAQRQSQPVALRQRNHYGRTVARRSGSAGSSDSQNQCGRRSGHSARNRGCRGARVLRSVWRHGAP